jgi:hypothetical protein
VQHKEKAEKRPGQDNIMADNKRNSVAGKIATPNLKAGSGSNKDAIDADSILFKAVGSRYD